MNLTCSSIGALSDLSIKTAHSTCLVFTQHDYSIHGISIQNLEKCTCKINSKLFRKPAFVVVAMRMVRTSLRNTDDVEERTNCSTHSNNFTRNRTQNEGELCNPNDASVHAGCTQTRTHAQLLLFDFIVARTRRPADYESCQLSCERTRPTSRTLREAREASRRTAGPAARSLNSSIMCNPLSEDNKNAAR